MLKTISAALLAASVIAAPALAAEQGKTATPAPVTNAAAPAPAAKTADKATDKTATKTAPVIKSEQAPSKLMNANAKMGPKHYRHHRAHKHHMGLLKTKHAPKHATKHVTHKVASKHIAPAKRG